MLMAVKFSSWNDLAGSIGQGPKGDICDIDRDYYPFPPDCENLTDVHGQVVEMTLVLLKKLLIITRISMISNQLSLLV